MPRIWSGRTWIVVLVVSVSSGIAACGSAKLPATTTKPPSSPSTRPLPTGGAPTTTVPTVTLPPSTTTTVEFAPVSPSASPDQASAELIAAWASSDRAAAVANAAPAAVDLLFALPYWGATLQPRGCSETISPATCTYRNTGTGALLEVEVSQIARGWYVTGAVIES